MVSVYAISSPTGKISPQPWLTAPETRTVIEALTADGTEVRFVGGCVRDAMARRPVSDVDIGTPDRPKTVIGLLEKAGIKAVPTGIGHGTVTAVVGARKFEITTLRRDVETDGRRAKVAFTDDWMIDSERRDLTINALSATPDGDVYDPHDGISDLAYGNIRFVGLAIDIDTWRPRLANGTGGLSGPAIKPLALNLVRRVYQSVARDRGIPIIGMGGIQTWQDAVEFHLAGATALAVGTALFVDPTCPVQIIDGLQHYLAERGIARITDLIGQLQDAEPRAAGS